MKVLAVLAISLHIATCYSYRHMPMKREISPAINDTCANFKELVWKKTHQAIDALNTDDVARRDLSREVEIQILIDEFSEAASKCIPNNRVYASVHVILDNLKSLIERFPSPKNVRKTIAEAQDYMDEHFDELHPVKYKLPHLRLHIEDFFKEHSKQAAAVFERTRSDGERASQIFRKIDLFHATRDIVAKVNDCLSLKPADVQSIFKCRQEVRSLALEVPRLVRDLSSRIKRELGPHRRRIDGLLANFNFKKNEIREWIKEEEMEHRFNYRD